MTANQIAFARAREERRANKEQERLKAFEAGIEREKAKAQRTSADAAFYQALSKQQEVFQKEQLLDSEKFKNVASGIQSIGKVIGSAVGALGALFA